MAESQLQILSDLHLESPDPEAPFLALLATLVANFRTVFLLLGNHEPYHSDWDEAMSKLTRFKDEMDGSFQAGKVRGEFVLLDQTRYDLSPTVAVHLFLASPPNKLRTLALD
ncbi:hypothetical protein VTN00DRAFT_1591 [Thermoascus crustaceus]|uniref:uncharacterized protein n=1 Tax=Thermoascus crustaceus TaxID=5088 RepID=UPI00374459E0